MSTRITEFHGYTPLSRRSTQAADARTCPFTELKCKKTRSGGACSLQPPTAEPVIICPNRLYADDFEVVRRVVRECFGDDAEPIADSTAEKRRRDGSLTGQEVVVYGQGFSGEIGIPAPASEGSKNSFQVDFLLAQVNHSLEPTSIAAVEVQTIDTTNSYKSASDAYYLGNEYVNETGDDSTGAGFNWENVTKRILPQIIYKGHALRREKLAQHGLFFVIPEAVLERIITRVGGDLLEYPRGPGTVTFHSYSLGEEQKNQPRALLQSRTFTTTVEQIAFAFVSPQNLPTMGIYEETLTQRLSGLSKKRKLD